MRCLVLIVVLFVNVGMCNDKDQPQPIANHTYEEHVAKEVAKEMKQILEGSLLFLDCWNVDLKNKNEAMPCLTLCELALHEEEYCGTYCNVDVSKQMSSDSNCRLIQVDCLSIVFF